MDGKYVTSGRLQGEIETLPLKRVVPNAWNPNEQDQETFNRLVEELRETGLIDPLQVVKLPDGMVYEIELPEGVIPDDGDWWMLLGGEHRWTAGRVIGWEEIDCVVLPEDKFGEQDFQELLTVRLNALKGDLNPEKFMKLWEKHVEKVGEDAAARLMGFAHRDVIDKMIKQVRTSLKGNVPDKVVEKLDARKDEIRTVEDLSKVLHEIMKENGNQVETNLIVFAFGGKRHMYVKCDPNLWSAVRKMHAFCDANGVDVNALLGQTVQNAVAAERARLKAEKQMAKTEDLEPDGEE